MSGIPSYWVLLHRVEHEGNLGAVARLATNFGAQGLVLVDPQCEVGPVARARAKHGVGLLYSARIAEGLAEARDLFDYMVATSATVNHQHGLTRHSFPASKLGGVIPSGSRIAIGFGPEGTGFVNEDLEYFDSLVTIPSNPEYPTLNLSHAVSVVLYEVFNTQGSQVDLGVASTPAMRHRTKCRFAALLAEVDEGKPSHRDVSLAFRNLVDRSFMSTKEASVLLGGLYQLGDALTAEFAQKDAEAWIEWKRSHDIKTDACSGEVEQQQDTRNDD